MLQPRVVERDASRQHLLQRGVRLGSHARQLRQQLRAPHVPLSALALVGCCIGCRRCCGWLGPLRHCDVLGDVFGDLLAVQLAATED